MSHAPWISPKSGNYLHSGTQELGGAGSELLEIGDDFVLLRRVVAEFTAERDHFFFFSSPATHIHSYACTRTHAHLTSIRPNGCVTVGVIFADRWNFPCIIKYWSKAGRWENCISHVNASIHLDIDLRRISRRVLSRKWTACEILCTIYE